LRIICDYCLTEYQVQAPPKSPSSDSGFSFRCSNCGRVFSANHPQQAEAVETPAVIPTEQPPLAPVAAAPEAVPSKDILVRQGDETYSANDLAAIQRWIVEGRLNRESLISIDGHSWTLLAENLDLIPFLNVMEKVQALEKPAGLVDKNVATTQPEPTMEAQFVDVAELESAVGIEPENTQDELDIDPFPTEEVPLPPTPILTNLKDLEDPLFFEAPSTEEVPFDYPLSDDHTLDAPKIDLKPEPGLPTLSHARDMIDAPGPTFAEENHPSFPTEEELLILEDEEPDKDPLGNELFAAVSSDWDDGIEDDDLAWVSGKKKNRRMFLGLMLVVLTGLTANLILNRKSQSTPPEDNTTATMIAKNDAEPSAPSALVASDLPTDSEEEPEKPEEKSSTEEPEVSTQAAKPKAAPQTPPSAKPVQRSKPADPNTQDRRSKLAKQAEAKRGPQPKTANDFVDRGRQATADGDYRTARIHYLDAVFMDPQNAAANQGLAFAALKQGDTPFAVNHFCKALKVSQPTSSIANEIRETLARLNEECP
jgi:hypothetical protein